MERKADVSKDYILIPGTQTRLYDGTVVILNRLPGTKWIVHNGYYEYNGVKQKGWYLSSIPSGTTMPVFNEDLVALRIVDEHCPCPPHPPIPPGPPPGPPAPIPLIFTKEDKEMIDRSMVTVATLADRDRLSSEDLIGGKIVRVNNAYGAVEYYEWDSNNAAWKPATLGYRYMTRDEITEAISDSIVDVVFEDANGTLVLTRRDESSQEVPLASVAHSPEYDEDSLTLRIPVYGSNDIVVTIPRDKSIIAGRFEPSYPLPSGKLGPAIILIVSDGVEQNEVVIDATKIYNTYRGGETTTITTFIESETSTIKADVKISPVAQNALVADSHGLLVDITGKVDKVDISEDVILASDGKGGFKAAKDDIKIQTSGVMEDGTLPSGSVVAAAITAAVSAAQRSIYRDIEAIQEEIADIKSQLVGPGDAGQIVVSTERGSTRSSYVIGGEHLSTSSNTVATESAIIDAFSWHSI